MVKCPKCGSENVNEDDSDDFIMGIAIGVPVALGLMEHDFQCRNCGHAW